MNLTGENPERPSSHEVILGLIQELTIVIVDGIAGLDAYRTGRKEIVGEF